MAQNLTIDDLKREVRAVYALHDAGDADAAFCEGHKGMLWCDRHHKHQGKHAAASGGYYAFALGEWHYSGVVRW
jgi:hypothetical protein